MTIFSFEKQEGSKLFIPHTSKSLDSLSAAELAALNDAAANAILIHLGTRHFPVAGLAVSYDYASATAVLKGLARDSRVRRSIVECCGGIEGVAEVDDRMSVAAEQEEEAEFYGNGSGAADGSGWMRPVGMPGVASSS